MDDTASCMLASFRQHMSDGNCMFGMVEGTVLNSRPTRISVLVHELMHEEDSVGNSTTNWP